MDDTQTTLTDTDESTPEIALKTDGDVYYALPTNNDAAETRPVAEYPCYLILQIKDLLTTLTTQTENAQSTIESVETTIPRGTHHYALVLRGHLYLLEEREYNPYTTRNEYSRVSTLGYVTKTVRHIEATLTATQNELNTIDTADALLDRICNPDNINHDNVRKIARNPTRPTLADYNVTQNTSSSDND